jgi:hypothetical protein
MDDEMKWLPTCVHYLNDAEASRVEQIIAANRGAHQSRNRQTESVPPRFFEVAS